MCNTEEYGTETRHIKQAATKYIRRGLEHVREGKPPLERYHKDGTRNEPFTIQAVRSVILVFGDTNNYIGMLYDAANEEEKQYFIQNM